ncbi:MAG: cytochrome c oxidase assembly protein [Alphaproteobacteria bacterium]|nr:cytochrome c oxidase assembly protein [Alphaproteobacteria bacterium]
MAQAMKNRNNRMLAGLLVVVAAMIGLSYASVPLYDLFCRVTGFGGTTQVAETESTVVIDRRMKVRFDSSVSGRLDWAFQPVQRQVELKVGENAVAYFRATNRSDEVLVGTATFNVTPLKAGPYFNKIECFCFTEQRLEPGQSVEMPVAFFVDPAISEDVDLDEVKTITLSYTFFPVEGKEPERPTKVSRLDRAGRPKVE